MWLMKHRYENIKKTLCILFTCATFLVNAQDLTGLRGRTPLTITGSIGTFNTYYYSSNPYQIRSPLSNTLFANLNIDIYGVQIPLSFHFSNNNRDFSHPFARFGMSPRYKDLQVHLGYRNMNFSPFTYSNLTFLGAGLEYNRNLLRLALFTGSLNQANEFDPEQITPGRPNTYHRRAYGLKLGVGNARNHFDIILFNARDDTLSIAPAAGLHLQPKENLVAGASFRVSFGQHISISSNVSASAYNNNMRSTGIELQEADPLNDYFTPRYGSVLRFAGDIRTNINFGRVQSMLQYRLIQPEFQSLGTSYISNNIQQMGLNVNTTLSRNRISTGFSIFYQEDNVTKTQIYTNTSMIYAMNATARMSDQFNISLSYNGFDQKQQDGTMVVNDSIRINRFMHNISVTPGYSFLDELDRSHSFTVSLNSSINKNQNKLITDPSEVTTMSTNLAYMLGITDRNININATIGYINSSSNAYEFNSTNMGAGAGKRFLDDDNLNIQINLNLAYGQVQGLTRNLSVMTGLMAGYTHGKSHTFNFRLNFNSNKNKHLEGLYSMHGYDTTVSLGYTYRIRPISPVSRNNDNH